MKKQTLLYCALALLACLLYANLCFGVYSGQWYRAVAMVLLASPILLCVLGKQFEGRLVRRILDLKRGSWAFLIGDTFVLTAAVANNTVAWRYLPKQGWYISWWWPLVCLLAGVVAGFSFHKMDSGNYQKASMVTALRSPTKVAHDGVAYPVLFGGLLFSGVPVLTHWSTASISLLVCVGAWIALCVCDMVRGLRPADLHPRWSAKAFCAIP